MDNFEEIYLRDIYAELKRIRILLESLTRDATSSSDGGRTFQQLGKVVGAVLVDHDR